MNTISVIIPNYNYARYLPERLDSILQQSHAIHEIIVLDDYSSDNSMEVLQNYVRFANFHIVSNTKNSGNVFLQWSKGVRMASGDLVWIAEADDKANPLFLEHLAPCFTDPQLALAYCASEVIDSDGICLLSNYADDKYLQDVHPHRWCNDYFCSGQEEVEQALSIKNTILNVSSVLFRRCAVQEIFDASLPSIERYKMAGDWFIYLELLRKYRIAYKAMVLNSHRRHQRSVTIHSAESALRLLHEVHNIHKHALKCFTLPPISLWRMYDHELQHFVANPGMPPQDFLREANVDELQQIWRNNSSIDQTPRHYFTWKDMSWLNHPPTGGPAYTQWLTQGVIAVWENMFPPKHPATLQTELDNETLFVCWKLFWCRLFPYIKEYKELNFPFRRLFDEETLELAIALPRWAYIFHQANASLQEAYSLTTPQGCADYMQWLYNEIKGHNEEQVLSEFLSSLVRWLFLHTPRPGVSVGRFIAEKVEQSAKLCWALSGWSVIYPNCTSDAIQIRDLEILLHTTDEVNDTIPLFFRGLMQYRDDARQGFPLYNSPDALKAILVWYTDEQKNNQHKHPLQDVLLKKLASYLARLEEVIATEQDFFSAKELSQKSCTKVCCPDILGGDLPLHRNIRLFKGTFADGGVNVVGFGRGLLGIGEDVRMAATALHTASVPVKIYIPPMDIPSAQNDMTVDADISPQPIYDTNLIFLPAGETLRLYMQDGPGTFNFRYNICAWQWELPVLPKPLAKALPLGQEFWISSTYTAATIAEHTDKPVLHMPMAVQLVPFDRLPRHEHGLPSDSFVFLYVFDGLSWATRKNPLAAIRAFQDAFPNNKDVILVIKTMNAHDCTPFWHAILAQTARDRRIFCINEVYSKQRLLSLFSCCDAYISLHRAEGFGRTIAEAMLLEKPVIATAWSGNADFTNEETAFPVTGKLIPLNKNDYIFWEDQYWCEPDHDMAVAALRECFYNPALAKIKAKAGQTVIRKNYSPETVGQLYIKRLRELGCL